MALAVWMRYGPGVRTASGSSSGGQRGGSVAPRADADGWVTRDRRGDVGGFDGLGGSADRLWLGRFARHGERDRFGLEVSDGLWFGWLDRGDAGRLELGRRVGPTGDPGSTGSAPSGSTGSAGSGMCRASGSGSASSVDAISAAASTAATAGSVPASHHEADRRPERAGDRGKQGATGRAGEPPVRHGLAAVDAIDGLGRHRAPRRRDRPGADRATASQTTDRYANHPSGGRWTPRTSPREPSRRPSRRPPARR